MKAALLALLLQEWGPAFYATEPPPETLTRLTWRFQEESANGYFVTREQLHKIDAEQQQCLDELGAAQVEAVSDVVPRWVWVGTGIFLGAAAVAVGGELVRSAL